MHRTDQDLIKAVVKEDSHTAFAELVKRYQSPLRYSLRQLTGWNEALADDLAQETFIKAHRALAGYKGKAKFSSWLYRIAYNEMVGHFRVARNRELTGHINDFDSVTDDLCETGGDASVDSANQNLHRDLAKAMHSLSDNQRMALHLHLHRECTQQEISDIMSIPLGTVKTLITRGKSRLQELLIEWNTAAKT